MSVISAIAGTPTLAAAFTMRGARVIDERVFRAVRLADHPERTPVVERAEDEAHQALARAARFEDVLLGAGALDETSIRILPLGRPCFRSQTPDEVRSIDATLTALERKHGLPEGKISIQVLIESVSAEEQVLRSRGPRGDRVGPYSFGAYDYGVRSG